MIFGRPFYGESAHLSHNKNKKNKKWATVNTDRAEKTGQRDRWKDRSSETGAASAVAAGTLGLGERRKAGYMGRNMIGQKPGLKEPIREHGGDDLN